MTRREIVQFGLIYIVGLGLMVLVTYVLVKTYDDHIAYIVHEVIATATVGAAK
jgi:hypothetical protein